MLTAWPCTGLNGTCYTTRLVVLVNLIFPLMPLKFSRQRRIHSSPHKSICFSTASLSFVPPLTIEWIPRLFSYRQQVYETRQEGVKLMTLGKKIPSQHLQFKAILVTIIPVPNNSWKILRRCRWVYVKYCEENPLHDEICPLLCSQLIAFACLVISNYPIRTG